MDEKETRNQVIIDEMAGVKRLTGFKPDPEKRARILERSKAPRHPIVKAQFVSSNNDTKLIPKG